MAGSGQFAGPDTYPNGAAGISLDGPDAVEVVLDGADNPGGQHLPQHFSSHFVPPHSAERNPRRVSFRGRPALTGAPLAPPACVQGPLFIPGG